MPLKLAVLGDSIAYGQGAGSRSDTVGARLAGGLTASGTPCELQVFAVPGATSDALDAQVVDATRWAPDVALIIIGANDLTHLVPPRQAATSLGNAVRGLRAIGTQVVVAPAPDLSVVPWVPVQLRAAVKAGSAQLREAQTHVALAEGARVSEIYASTSASFAADPRLFSEDRFHPSSAGYALISAALAPAIFAAAAQALEPAG